MGLMQTSTTICGQKELNISAVEKIDSLSEENTEKAKEIAEAEAKSDLTKEQLEYAKKLCEDIKIQNELNKKSAEEAKKDLLKKSLEETNEVIENVEMFDESFTKYLSEMLIGLHKELESEDEQD